MRSGAYVAEGRGDLPSVSDFEERYCGRWDDFREYAEHWATETDMMDRWPDDAVRYFNWDAWTRDMAMDHTVVNAPAPEYGVFVFRDLDPRTPQPTAAESTFEITILGTCRRPNDRQARRAIRSRRCTPVSPARSAPCATQPGRPRTTTTPS